MYRVVVNSKGKYNNTVTGARYCFTKRSVIELATIFTRMECVFIVEKFIHIHGDIFTWSETEVSKKIWDKIYENLEVEDEDA